MDKDVKHQSVRTMKQLSSMDHVVNASLTKDQQQTKQIVSILFVIIETKFSSMEHARPAKNILEMFPDTNVIDQHASEHLK